MNPRTLKMLLSSYWAIWITFEICEKEMTEDAAGESGFDIFAKRLDEKITSKDFQYDILCRLNIPFQKHPCGAYSWKELAGRGPFKVYHQGLNYPGCMNEGTYRRNKDFSVGVTFATTTSVLKYNEVQMCGLLRAIFDVQKNIIDNCLGGRNYARVTFKTKMHNQYSNGDWEIDTKETIWRIGNENG